jgi:hypothetical protein
MMELDVSKFKGRMPYDSQLVAVYQPLIGWRSRLTLARAQSTPVTLPEFPKVASAALLGSTEVNVTLAPGNQSFKLAENGAIVEAGPLDLFKRDLAEMEFDTPDFLDGVIVRGLQQEARKELATHPPNDDAFWGPFWTNALSTGFLNKMFVRGMQTAHVPFVAYPSNEPTDPVGAFIYKTRSMFSDPVQAANYIFNREVYIARFLHSLLPAEGGAAAAFPTNVNTLLLKTLPAPSIAEVLKMLDPLYLALEQNRDAVLSPIGVIHVFREYYFEFETFLGPSVEHVWLSPGAVTEMIEVSTRRTLQEYTLEQFVEQIQKSDHTTTTADDLSQAMSDERSNDTKLGSSLSGGVNILIANIQANGSISTDESQKAARQNMHKTSRQQTATLSSEIRSNFKSTFRTVTENTDTRSKRYTISNNSNDLMNYELRRKMRQVGVQMQDAGTQLCWQIYLDDPGATLGVSQLVHLAALTDLSPYVHESVSPEPGPVTAVITILVPVPNPGDRSNLGPISAGVVGFVAASLPGAIVGVGVYEVIDGLFGGGKHKSKDYAIGPTTAIHQQYKVAMPDGYQLAPDSEQTSDSGNEPFNKEPGGQVPLYWLGRNGQNVHAHLSIVNLQEGIMDLVVSSGKVSPGEIIEFQAKIRVDPTPDKVAAVKLANQKVAEENSQKDQAKERAIRKDFVDGVKERVKLASGITPRKTEDLREEERTIVYRALMQRLMKEAWGLDVDPTVAHMRSELIKSIFDVDRMLYFVAPEWWEPRRHVGFSDKPPIPVNLASQMAIQSAQFSQKLTGVNIVNKAGQQRLASEDLANWGGVGRQDNYLITEDSTPAKLGASLGWLLQLDGDNLRNAFLNAPWVKAVLPILPGKERDALEWLKQAKVEGSDGLSDDYAGDDLKTFEDEYFDKYGVQKKITVEDALDMVADAVSAKHANSFDVVSEVIHPVPGKALTIAYVRPDRVFETGFDPLADGFRATPKEDFEVIDQWVEILPTDQVVAVAVDYDPKTGELI